MADRADRGDGAGGNGAHHHLLVETPQVLDRAASTGHDDQIRTMLVPFRQGGKSTHRACHLFRRALPLHQHGPHDDAAGKPVCKPMKNIANHRPRRAGNHPDGGGKVRQRPLLGGIEQSLRRQPLAGLFEQGQQRALARQLHPLDHDLILGTAGIGRDLARCHDLQPVFRHKTQPLRIAAPHHRVDNRVFVFQAGIHVARRRTLHARQLSAQPHEAETIFHRALQGVGKIADG